MILRFLFLLAALATAKGFFKPQNLRHNIDALNGVVRGRYGEDDANSDDKGKHKLQVYSESDDDSDHVDAVEPDLRELFPLPGTTASAAGTGPTTYDRDEPNWLELEVDDPLWLDKPWPTEVGPESSAYARHLQWKRALPDGERVRWQKWAIYDRMLKKGQFEYGVEDFVRQSMESDIAVKAAKYEQESKMLEANLWKTIALGFQEEEKSEVEATVKSFYSAFNRKNYDEIRVLLLPCETTSCNLPGHDRIVGVSKVHKTYKKLLTNTKPMATVRPEVVSIKTSGFVAVVQVVEHIESGGVGAGDLKKIGNRQQQKAAAEKKMSGDGARDKEVKMLRKVHSTLVLRKFNQQWRILLHEALPVKSSDYLGGATETSMNQRSGSGSGASSGTSGAARGMFRETLGKLMKVPAMAGTGKADELQSAAANAASREIAKALTRKGLPPEIAKVLSDNAGRSIASGDREGGPSVRQFNSGGLNGFIIKGPGAPLDPNNRGKPSGGGGGDGGGASSGITARIGPDGRSVQYIDVESESEGESDGEDGNGDLENTRRVIVGSPRRSEPAIDEGANISRQTMQALRLLVRAGRISRAVKDALVLDMIDCITDKKPSMAEKAYKMLIQGKDRGGAGKLTKDVPDDVLEEFAEQCVLIAEILNAEGVGSWNNALPEDDEDEDSDDDEDSEEDEALIAALSGSLASSSPDANDSSQENGEDGRDDDEEAVIEALAGSLK
jgi:hypothetical protein